MTMYKDVDGNNVIDCTGTETGKPASLRVAEAVVAGAAFGAFCYGVKKGRHILPLIEFVASLMAASLSGQSEYREVKIDIAGLSTRVLL